MTRFLLIRHGQSMANLEAVFAGNYDTDLTELGHKQAECSATFVAKNYQVDAVYSSDLKRAYQTGEYAAKLLGLDIQKEPDMREIRAGKWEGKTFETIAIEYADDFHVWLTDIGNAKCTDGESVAELAGRVIAAIERIAKANPDKTVLITTHATPIRVLEWHMSGKPLSHMKDIPWVANASVSEVHYENGKLTPVKISMAEHLGTLKTSLPANV